MRQRRKNPRKLDFILGPQSRSGQSSDLLHSLRKARQKCVDFVKLPWKQFFQRANLFLRWIIVFPALLSLICSSCGACWKQGGEDTQLWDWHCPGCAHSYLYSILLTWTELMFATYRFAVAWAWWDDEVQPWGAGVQEEHHNSLQGKPLVRFIVSLFVNLSFWIIMVPL